MHSRPRTARRWLRGLVCVALPWLALGAAGCGAVRAGDEHARTHEAASTAAPASDPYAALERLVADLGRAAQIARAAPPSRVPYGRGEGALHVLRLLRRAVDEEIAWADTQHPYFQIQDERFSKLALGNPDNLYLVARVDDDAVYRIRGRLGTTADFAIQLYQGYPGIGRPFDARGSIDRDRLQRDADGRFEVWVGGEPRSANWIPLHPDSRRILVRFTYGDWAREEAGELRIERVGTRGVAARPAGDAEVARRIDAASAYLLDALEGYLSTLESIQQGLQVNQLTPLRRTGAGGLANQYSVNGRYVVAEDEALIVRTRPSGARYQGFQLGSEWFEALDFTNQQTSLNTHQAHLGSDGRYHFVISRSDPGVPNWLDASGAPEGQMLLRWQGAAELGPEHQPELLRVALSEVRDKLPADEPIVGPGLRRERIAARQLAIERRYGLSAR